MTARIVLTAAIALAAMTAQASAQSLDPKACAPQDRATVGQPPAAEAPQPPAGAPNEALSDKLARTDGVICPPANVDPEIHAPAPGAGRTPVIPPPGSPGGDPSVRPK